MRSLVFSLLKKKKEKRKKSHQLVGIITNRIVYALGRAINNAVVGFHIADENKALRVDER